MGGGRWGGSGVPGERIVGSRVELPFALPTAVAGLVFSNLYVANGWLGRFLVPLGIEGAYSRLAVVLVLVFIGSKIFLVGMIGKIPPVISLGVIFGLIAGGDAGALWKPRREEPAHEHT